MESAENPIRYNFKVNNNHPTLLKSKKKSRIVAGSMSLFAALFFVAITCLAVVNNNPSTFAIIMFGGLVAFALICAIYFFATIKETEKDRTRSRDLIFYEHSFALVEHDEIKNKDKSLSKCLYARHANKQFISKFIEKSDMFEIKIFTGTYNGIPQYKKFIFPKEVVPVEKAEEFKTFIKTKVGNHYKIKIS